MQASHDRVFLEEASAPPEDIRPGRAALEGRSERDRAEETLRRLLRVADALSGAMSAPEVAAIVTGELVGWLGGRSAIVVLIEGQQLVNIGSRGYAESARASLERWPLEAGLPITEAARTGRPILVESEAGVRRRFPHAIAGPGVVPGGALACVPLVFEGRSIGALAVRFEGTRRFNRTDRTFLRTMAHTCAQALERTRLWDDTRRLNDILRDAVRAQRATAAELTTVIDAMGEPVIVCDRHGRVRFANQASRVVLGAARFESYDDIRSRFMSAEGLPSLDRPDRQGPVELQLRETGSWLELTTYPVPLSTAGSEARRGDGDDLARERAATVLLLRDVTAARVSQQVRDAFLGILSHELRTPITTIYGGARVLARPGLSEEARREVSADIGAEAERLHRLVEDLLVLAQTERGTLSVGADPVLVQHLLPGIVESEGSRWPGKRFELAIAPGMPTVSADPTYVEQVVRNLVGNGAKYSLAGTTIAVRAEPAGDLVHVRILDEGPGIASDEVDRLFELFYRSPATAAQSAGAGIGLFACRALVEAMGGRIWALPRPTGGAEFGFSLPVLVDDEL
jgi:K+-sensing histidine kinase KdpD